MAKTVGDPGTLLEHVAKLAAAVRAGNWSEAFRLVIDIFGHLQEPFECPMMATASTDDLADRLDALASMKGVGAFPWMQLLPLLLQVLSLIFGPKPPAPPVVPPAQVT